MADEYERLRLQWRWEHHDAVVAAMRKPLREGSLPDFQRAGQIGWIQVQVREIGRIVQELAEKFPGDSYITRPLSSQPTEEELRYEFDELDVFIRHVRARLANGLDPRFKRDNVSLLRRYLAQVEENRRQFAVRYPHSWFAGRPLSSDPTPVELEIPETVSGTSDGNP